MRSNQTNYDHMVAAALGVVLLKKGNKEVKLSVKKRRKV